MKRKIAIFMLVVYTVMFTLPVFAATLEGSNVTATSNSITIGGQTWYASNSGRIITVKDGANTYQFYVSESDYSAIQNAYTTTQNNVSNAALNKKSDEIFSDTRNQVNKIGNIMTDLAPDATDGAALLQGTPIDQLLKKSLNVHVYAILVLLIVSVIVNGACLISGVYEIITGKTPGQSGGGGYGSSGGYSMSGF